MARSSLIAVTASRHQTTHPQRPQARSTKRVNASVTLGSSTETIGDAGYSATPCVIVPGFLRGGAAYKGLAVELSRLGCSADIVPINRTDWYPTLMGRPFTALLRKMDDTLQRACDKHGCQVALVAHSAGGFLSRILLGDEVYNGEVFGRSSQVSTLVTLGTPHTSLEAYPLGRVPETRVGERSELPETARMSSLRFANHCYPRGDCFPGTRVVCVAARTLQGVDHSLVELGQSLVLDRERAWRLVDEYLAHSSYKASCGHGDVWGDGITPLECACLEGAECIILDNVYHNPETPTWYQKNAALFTLIGHANVSCVCGRVIDNMCK